jgi:hypothetical protein
MLSGIEWAAAEELVFSAAGSLKSSDKPCQLDMRFIPDGGREGTEGHLHFQPNELGYVHTLPLESTPAQITSSICTSSPL